MTWRDKLEVGLKEDAPFRKDNLPENEVRGPEIGNGPGRSSEVPLSRRDRIKTPMGPLPGLRANEPDRRNVVSSPAPGRRRRRDDVNL